MIYYLYRLQNSLKFDKCGATTDWDKRCRDNRASHGPQSIITELETMEGPNTPEMWQIVGDREWELADLNGYPRGTHYRVAREKRMLGGLIGCYTHVVNFANNKGPLNQRKYTLKIAKEMRDLYASGKYTQKEIALIYNINLSTAKNIFQGRVYK